MLMIMTATDDTGRQTRFKQCMKIPAHGFLDIAASLDGEGMKDCLRSHLAGGRLRSALSQVRSFALPRLMLGIANDDGARKEASFSVDQVKVEICVSG